MWDVQWMFWLWSEIWNYVRNLYKKKSSNKKNRKIITITLHDSISPSCCSSTRWWKSCSFLPSIIKFRFHISNSAIIPSLEYNLIISVNATLIYIPVADFSFYRKKKVWKKTLIRGHEYIFFLNRNVPSINSP